MSDEVERHGPDGKDEASAAAHAYFQAIEQTFIELRGAPLLLSPADWLVARQWHDEGIPLAVVRRALREVFARRAEKGATRSVQSLKYCRSAVEAAWRQQRELGAPAGRRAAEPLDVAGRLRALAAALPERLPGRATWAARIVDLAGDAETVEERLSALDQELLASVGEALGGGDRAELEASLGAALERLSGRLPAAEQGAARRRLERQLLRRRLGLPVLSLFSPEARGGAAD